MLQEVPSASSMHNSNRKAASDRTAVSNASSAAPPELVRLLATLAKQTRALVTCMLSEIDVAAGQDQLLLALAEDDMKVVSALADELSVRPSTVSKMADRLEEKGLIERSPDLSDQRRVCIRLTPAGVEKRASVQAVLAKLQDGLLRDLGDEPAATIAALGNLDRILTARLRRLR